MNLRPGMGGGLLQKVNRDTMSFATKLSRVIYHDGFERSVMKAPKGDMTKRSLPGEFAVYRSGDQPPLVYPAEVHVTEGVNEFKVVYDHGKICKWDDFTTIRQRAEKQWSSSPLIHNPISEPLESKVQKVMESQAIASICS